MTVLKFALRLHFNLSDSKDIYIVFLGFFFPQITIRHVILYIMSSGNNILHVLNDSLFQHPELDVEDIISFGCVSRGKYLKRARLCYPRTRVGKLCSTLCTRSMLIWMSSVLMHDIQRRSVDYQLRQ